MKVALYAMGEKGFEVLRTLIEEKLHVLISEVIAGTDRNMAGDHSDRIMAMCREHGIKCIRRGEAPVGPSDHSMAISWRWMIPGTTSRLIVLHDSLLPRYRGFAPLPNMLINGEKEIGVSAIFASDEYDRGGIIAQRSVRIEYPIRIAEAIRIVSQCYVHVARDIFVTLSKGGTLTSTPQNEAEATYSLWRDEDDYAINWEGHASDILRFIDAVSMPYKGASAFINGTTKVRVLEATLEPDVTIENRDAGKVIFMRSGFPVVVCGTGLLRLLKVVDDRTGEDLIPFSKFRIRFQRTPGSSA